jgi:hypothetical protein
MNVLATVGKILGPDESLAYSRSGIRLEYDSEGLDSPFSS